MELTDILSKVPAAMVLGTVGALLIFLLLVPIALRLAGLSGDQIQETIKSTLQFFIAIVGEFRNINRENK